MKKKQKGTEICSKTNMNFYTFRMLKNDKTDLVSFCGKMTKITEIETKWHKRELKTTQMIEYILKTSQMDWIVKIDKKMTNYHHVKKWPKTTEKDTKRIEDMFYNWCNTWLLPIQPLKCSKMLKK